MEAFRIKQNLQKWPKLQLKKDAISKDTIEIYFTNKFVKSLE